MISDAQLAQYQTEGYLIVRGLFAGEEVEFFKQHYEEMRLREARAENVAFGDTRVTDDQDPLKKYPRLLQMHRRDEASLRWLLDDRLKRCLIGLLGREPYAVQTMLYFKPAGARGQALHQDQYFLRVQPGTCMAAWMALDDCDEENGCMQVVPGSHTWSLLCTTQADQSVSFTDVTVPLPEGERTAPVVMKAGDVLFFNGQLVHGSLPNISQDRFRRSLIAHYIVGEAEQVYRYYHPVLRMDGTEVKLGTSEVGGTCGTWIDRNGQPALETEVEKVKGQFFNH